MAKVVKSVANAGETTIKTAKSSFKTVEPVYKIGKSAVEESKNWKSKLTAALDDTTLFASLGILCGFYFFYTLTNYILGGNTRDQDTITSECSCRDSARHLYRSLFSLFLIAWFFVYSYVPFQRVCQSFGHYVPEWKTARRLQKFGDFLETVKRISFWKRLFRECCSLRKGRHTATEPDPMKQDHLQSSNKKSHKKVLWYKYYKLYVMGYVEKIIPSSPSAPAPADSNTKKDLSCKNKILSIHLVSWIRGFILVIKYIAQLATVPLLMVQMFDTYALLCFAPNHLYCGDRSEYDIHLTQVVITMFFYTAIAVAQLTTTVLEWDPIASFDQLHKKARRENDA